MSDQKKATPKKETVPKVTKKATPKKELTSPYITDNEYPTLIVENFGKIERAEIELAPFTLFVGDNNSGKSYLMNLIWGLSNIDLLGRNLLLKTYVNVAKNNGIFNTQGQFQQCVLTIEHLKDIITLYCELLYTNKETVVSSIFNSDLIIIDKLLLTIPESYFENKKVSINVIDSEQLTFNIKKFNNELSLSVSSKIDDKNMLNFFIKEWISHIISFICEFKSPDIFLPVSRTGFMLTANMINMNRWGTPNSEEVTDLLPSTRDFMKNIASLPMRRKSKNDPLFRIHREKQEIYKSLVKFIDEKIIHGSIRIDPESEDIRYTPYLGKESPFPLHIMSGVLTEIAPLSLFLQYGMLQKTLFMEEPEMSLHPELQQQIARLFIKMINNSKQIFITTHSDTIIQHINNMIKLSNHTLEKQKELCTEYNYPIDILDSEKKVSSDIIELDKVRMYEFIVNTENKTEVTSLQGDKNGFSQPKFQQVLTKIYNESMDLEHDEDEEC